MRLPFFSLALLLALAVVTPARAEPSAPAAPPPAFGADAQADIDKVEDYLNGLTTMKARFVQTAPNGAQLAGDFTLKRPGRLRFQYDPPVKDFIVADGTFIYYYDSEMKEQKNTLISQSLADFFLRKNLSLSGDVKVMDIGRENGQLILTVAQTKDPLAGTLSMAFTENPLTLKKWRVVDAQGLVTEIELFDPVTGIALENEQFRYYNPERSKGKLN